MRETPSFAGIEVGRDWLDLALRPNRQHERFQNDEERITRLVARVRPPRPILIVLEATGGPEGSVTAALATSGLAVAIIHPRQVRDFANAFGQLAKTDTLDAYLLAPAAEVVRPESRPFPSAATQVLSAVLTRRRPVIIMIVVEHQRWPTMPDGLRPRLDAHILWLRAVRDALDRDLHNQIRRSPL